MKIAIAICEEFADMWDRQAREGDNTGASDHRADAARQIIAELRNVNAAPSAVVLDDERAAAIGAHLWMPADISAPTEAPKDFGDRSAYAFKQPGAGAHDPWYVVLPNMAALKLGYHADDEIDRQHAEFIAAAINRAIARAASPQPVAQTLTPEWLWSELMDYCRKQGTAPANNPRLFEIVTHARSFLATQSERGADHE